MSGKIRISNSPAASLKNKNRLAVQLSRVIETSEKEFNKLISEVESDPLFKRLKEDGALKRQGFENTTFGSGALSFNDVLFAGGVYPELGAILESHKSAIPVIKKIGEENFTKYFLYDDSGAKNDETADALGITTEEFNCVQALADKVAVLSDIFCRSGIAAENNIVYEKIAAFEKNRETRDANPRLPCEFSERNNAGGQTQGRSSDFSIVLYSLNLARGIYRLDWQRIKQLEKTGLKLKPLLNKINLINLRKTAVYRFLEKIASGQRAFLVTGNRENILPLTRAELAERLGVHPSAVSRMIKNRSVSLPWGEEAPLKIFVNKRSHNKEKMVKIIIEKSGSSIKGWQLSKAILEKFGEFIPVRTVNYYRKKATKGVRS